MKLFSKIRDTVVVISIWIGIIWGVWFLFDPETFWQRVFCVLILEFVPVIVLGAFAIFFLKLIWEEES